MTPTDLLGPADLTTLAVPVVDSVPTAVSNPGSPALAYAVADLPTGYGIAYEFVGRRARLVVPNSRQWRYQLTELAIPGALLLYAAAAGWAVFRVAFDFLVAGRRPDPFGVAMNGFL